MGKWLVIGNGAREHAIIEHLAKSDQTHIFNFATGMNPGINWLAEDILIGDIKNMDNIKKVAEAVKPDYAVVGPDDPIALGASNILEELGIPTFAPKKEHAQIEASKGFARDLMRRYGIDDVLPKFYICKSEQEVRSAIKILGEDYVVKADGLMGGKGVMVFGEHINTVEETISFANKSIEKFGQVVIEERLIGVEFSLMSFTDGKTVYDMPIVQDHKRANLGDTGPNTGGMGSYSDANHSLPFLKEEHIIKAHETNKKVVDALLQEFKEPYVGILYGGFMLTSSGVKVIEYNARFGDPEGINALELLETPLRDIIIASLEGKLDSIQPVFENKATVLKYVVPYGYPEKPKMEEKVIVKDWGVPDNASLYYASVEKKGDDIFTTSSRAFAIIAKSDTIAGAEEDAEYFADNFVEGPLVHRRDIGTKELIGKYMQIVAKFRKPKV